MKIQIECEAKEIAALVLEIQERQEKSKTMVIRAFADGKLLNTYPEPRECKRQYCANSKPIVASKGNRGEPGRSQENHRDDREVPQPRH